MPNCRGMQESGPGCPAGRVPELSSLRHGSPRPVAGSRLFPLRAAHLPARGRLPYAALSSKFLPFGQAPPRAEDPAWPISRNILRNVSCKRPISSGLTAKWSPGPTPRFTFSPMPCITAAPFSKASAPMPVPTALPPFSA